VVGAQVGVDDEVGLKVRPRRLDEDVDLSALACTAERVANDPAHGIAGGDGTRADELLARLKRDVGDLAGRGIDLIERPDHEGIDLHGVDEAVAHRLHPGRFIGLRDPLFRISRFGLGFPALTGFNCPGSGSGFGSSTTCTGPAGSALSTAGAASS
jgi:hypothetical protein